MSDIIKMYKLLPAAALLLSLVTCNAFSACKFETGGIYGSLQDVTMPLRISTISVPPDTPVGNVIYQQDTNVATAGIMTVNCVTAGVNKVFYDFDSSVTPVDGFSNVYATGFPGIGVRYSVKNTNFPASVLASTVAPINNAIITSFQPAKLDVTISLIKTADTIAAGSMQLNNLPHGMYSAGRSDSDKAPYYKFSFSGALQVTVPTCNIAPASATMTVEMGAHPKSEFTGQGSGTEWKNASISLINCPQFFGNSITSVGTYTGGNSFSNTAALTANGLSVKLSPTDGINNSDASIMKIASSSDAATGIGIQLSSSESETGKLNINNKITRSLPMGGVIGSLDIPLYARFIQTASSVSPGTAIGNLVYTITYQ